MPDSSTYGVSAAVSDGALWIGGNTLYQSLKSVYRISVPETGTVELNSFPEPPAAMDNFAGCAFEDTVIIGAGNMNGKPERTGSNRFFRKMQQAVSS